MQYTVVINQRRKGDFTASVPALPGCRSRGTTEDEAVANIRTAIARQQKRMKIIRIEVEENGVKSKNPWDSIIGMFENDPIFDKVEREIKKARAYPITKTRRKK